MSNVTSSTSLPETELTDEPLTLQIETPRIFLPLLRQSRYKGIHGGRGGAKSWFFAELLIERCILQRTRAVCIREVQRTLAQSVKRLLEDTMERLGVAHLFRMMSNHIETPNDGIIIFNGMQNHTAESIKSLEAFDVAWVEEAQSLSQRSLDLLRPTIRMGHSELWFSWNPRRATDPIDSLLRGDNPPPDAIVVEANYDTNPWFPEVLRREMEYDRGRDPEKYLHVWRGAYERNAESRVFKNWTVDEFPEPWPSTVFYLGGDWGFSVDPSVLVRLYVDERPGHRKRIYIDHEVYRVGCEIDYTPAFFDGLVCGCEPNMAAPPPERLMCGCDPVEELPGPKCGNPLRHNWAPDTCRDPQNHAWARKWVATADSARPETISYLRRHGYPKVTPAIKGGNSVKEGVIFLQGYDIIVHPRCTHVIDELTMYSYVVDKLTNQVTPILEDKKNHVIDSIRYAIEKLRLGKRGLTW